MKDEHSRGDEGALFKPADEGILRAWSDFCIDARIHPGIKMPA